MIEIDMQMPEKCGLCPCFHFDNPMYCQAVKADKNKKIVSPYVSPRPKWCPLKEQEAVEPRVSTAEQRCGYCNKVIEMDGWKTCPWCGKMIDWERWLNENGTHDNS